MAGRQEMAGVPLRAGFARRTPAQRRQRGGQRIEAREESLLAMAQRLDRRVDWARLSEAALRRAFGAPAPRCRERAEYEAGQVAAASGSGLPAGQSLSFRAGFRTGVREVGRRPARRQAGCRATRRRPRGTARAGRGGGR